MLGSSLAGFPEEVSHSADSLRSMGADQFQQSPSFTVLGRGGILERARNILVTESSGTLCAFCAGANQSGFWSIARKHRTMVKLIPVWEEITEKKNLEKSDSTRKLPLPFKSIPLIQK